MIDSAFDVRLNGIRYRLAVSAEGEHYVKDRQPLRLQTGAVVQGETGKFQLRPDILEWRISDFSGGEGLKLFNQTESNRYWKSYNCDTLTEPGKLQLARETIPLRGDPDNAGSTETPMVDSLQVVAGDGYIFGSDGDYVHFYDPSSGSGVGFDLTPALANMSGAMMYPLSNPYWYYGNTVGEVRRMRVNGGSLQETLVVDDVFGGDGDEGGGLAYLDNILYVLLTSGLYQIQITGDGVSWPITPATDETEDLLSDAVRADRYDDKDLWPMMVNADNKLYIANNFGGSCNIYKVNPPTVTQVGYTEKVTSIHDFAATGLVWAAGILYIFGVVGDLEDISEAGSRRTILYINGENYGAIGELRPDDTLSTGDFIFGLGATSFDRVYFTASSGPGDGTFETQLFALNTIDASIHGLGVVSTTRAGSPTAVSPSSSVAILNEDILFGNSGNHDDQSHARTVQYDLKGDYVDTDTYTAEWYSSINDFGLTDEKVLAEITLACEPLPADASIKVEYQINQSGSWSTATTYSTDDGTGEIVKISTGASPVLFRDLQLRVSLYNGGTQTVTPVVKSVGARATVASTLNAWDLILDLSDEAMALNRSHTGKQQIDNLTAIADTVVEFDDGYPYRLAGDFNSHSVVVDRVRLSMTRPGEGYGYISLREV